MNNNGHERSRTPVANESPAPTTDISSTDTQRFASQVMDGCDVPPEFQNALEVVTDAHGPLELCFFLPAMVRPDRSGTAVIPRRLACILKDHLALLSLTADSDHVVLSLFDRSRLLGYAITGFLLDCWIMLYHAGTPREIQIQFPVQSGELYAMFVNALFHTDCESTHGLKEPINHAVMPVNCPSHFNRFLHAHPELGQMHTSFLQTPVPFGKNRRQKCANFLLARTENALIILADEETPGRSWLGLRLTYLFLRSLMHAEWKDQFHLQRGILLLYVGSTEFPVSLEWSVAMRFREAALEWIDDLNAVLVKYPPNAEPQHN